MNSLIEKGSRHGRTADRVGWALLIALTAVLVVAMLAGLHSLAAA